MIYQFNIVIKGEDSLDEKVKKSIAETPELATNLIHSFLTTLMLAFRLEKSDNISLEQFRSGRIEESTQEIPIEIQPTMEE